MYWGRHGEEIRGFALPFTKFITATVYAGRMNSRHFTHLNDVQDVHIEVLHGEGIALGDANQQLIAILEQEVFLGLELALALWRQQVLKHIGTVEHYSTVYIRHNSLGYSIFKTLPAKSPNSKSPEDTESTRETLPNEF